jgi:hypothetical protein
MLPERVQRNALDSIPPLRLDHDTHRQGGDNQMTSALHRLTGRRV